jgi:hypothetical protein
MTDDEMVDIFSQKKFYETSMTPFHKLDAKTQKEKNTTEKQEQDVVSPHHGCLTHSTAPETNTRPAEKEIQ